MMIDFSKLCSASTFQNKPVPLIKNPEVEILAVLTNCFTGKVEHSKVVLEKITKESGEIVIQLHGGPTGHESFIFQRKNLKILCANGWCACMGAIQRYDDLVVPPDQMEYALNRLGLF